MVWLLWALREFKQLGFQTADSVAHHLGLALLQADGAATVQLLNCTACSTSAWRVKNSGVCSG